MTTDLENVQACGAEFYKDLILEHSKRCSKQTVELFIHKISDQYLGEISVFDYTGVVYSEVLVHSETSDCLSTVLVRLLEETSCDRRLHEDHLMDERNGDKDSDGCRCLFCVKNKAKKF